MTDHAARTAWMRDTISADQEWLSAMRIYVDRIDDATGPKLDQLRAWITEARRAYRHRILRAFFVHLAPIPLDGTIAIPPAVAELAAEEWDLRTRWVACP